MVAQYYDLARPDGDRDPIVEKIKVGCVGCHSPSAYYALDTDLLVSAPQDLSVVTLAQWYADQIFSNRLKHLQPREEVHEWVVPPNAVSLLTITAERNFRRMPESFADYIGIVRRPTVLINSASAVIILI